MRSAEHQQEPELATRKIMQMEQRWLVTLSRGYFKTPSSVTSCRRDERSLRRDERVVRVGQGAVFGIEAS
jgi:hypothetical protein